MTEVSPGSASAENSALQRESFDQLVDSGVYSKGFSHHPQRIAFFRSVLSDAVTRLDPAKRLSLLDCGCGTGAWLLAAQQLLAEAGRSVRLMGFDLSERMVDVAREELAGHAEPDDLKSGDLLKRDSYRFQGTEQGFDLLLAYDVVQQLPPDRQFACCELITESIAPGGFALIFDHDKSSLFGMKMGFRKFVTRNFRVPLVPDYYCNAKYPSLTGFAKRLGQIDGISTELRIDSEKKKCALIIHRTGG